MIDKDGNIITLKEQIAIYYCFIKENTAQIAIVISVLAAVYKIGSDYFFYLINYGYYKYFGIDGTLMLPYNKNNFYQSVGQMAIFLIYWSYATLSVRTLKLKRNYVKKFIFFGMIPLVLSIVLVYGELLSWQLTTTIIAVIILFFLQWFLIFIFGCCLPLSFDKETIDLPKHTGKRKNSWGDANYMLFGFLLLFFCIVLFFYSGYQNNYRKATEQRVYGTVIINNEKYAVIDANTEKIILQKCEINGSTLCIDKNTYLCANNEVLICYETFDNVVVQ